MRAQRGRACAFWEREGSSVRVQIGTGDGPKFKKHTVTGSSFSFASPFSLVHCEWLKAWRLLPSHGGAYCIGCAYP